MTALNEVAMMPAQAQAACTIELDLQRLSPLFPLFTGGVEIPIHYSYYPVRVRSVFFLIRDAEINSTWHLRFGHSELISESPDFLLHSSFEKCIIGYICLTFKSFGNFIHFTLTICLGIT